LDQVKLTKIATNQMLEADFSLIQIINKTRELVKAKNPPTAFDLLLFLLILFDPILQNQ
jgi:hypothetical protein